MSVVEGFAAVPNWMIRDERFSGNALLVFMALATHTGPGGIHPSQATLCRESRLGVTVFRVALRELIDLGVASRVRRINAVGHRLSDGYELHFQGSMDGWESLPSDSEHRESLPSDSEGPTLRFRGLVPTVKEEPIKKNPSIVSPDRFEEFWSLYPRKAGKQAARLKFAQAVKRADVELIVEGARRFANDPNLPEAQFIPHPTTWLNQGRWEDEPLPDRGQYRARSTVELGREADRILRERAAGGMRQAVST